MAFEWDDEKARRNLSKHSVTFNEAASVFGDAPRSFEDASHSAQEHRYSVLGWSSRHRLLMVIMTVRTSNIRIISARKATKAEVKAYGEA